MMPFDPHSVNTCVLRFVLRAAATFEDFVQVGKIAMVVALGPASLASQRAACTSLFPLIVKHCTADLLQLIFFTHLSRVTVFDWFLIVAFCDCFALRCFSLRRDWRCRDFFFFVRSF
jgi:hypothetical protein